MASVCVAHAVVCGRNSSAVANVWLDCGALARPVPFLAAAVALVDGDAWCTPLDVAGRALFRPVPIRAPASGADSAGSVTWILMDHEA